MADITYYLNKKKKKKKVYISDLLKNENYLFSDSSKPSGNILRSDETWL